MLKLSHKLMPAVGVIAIAIVAMLAMVGTGKLRVPAVKATNSLAAPSSQPPALSAEQRGRVRATLEALPLAFEANRGQTDPQVKYMARGNGYTVFLTPDDTVFAVHSSSSSSSASGKFATRSAAKAVRASGPEITAAVHMKLVGANPHSQIAAGRELPGHTNYFIGNDPSKWQTGVKQYAAVSYRDVYPGVNMAFHGQQRQLEFDFIVAPGAQANAITMGFSGDNKLATDEAGNLILSSVAGNVVLHKPVAYQERDGKRALVDVGFQVKNRHEVAFALGSYDRSRELVIDPSLSYATYLGGTAEDDGYAIAVDGSGNAYVTGQTKSTAFPTVSGAYSTTNAGGFDVFVTKIAPDGKSLVFSTYVGGPGDDSGNAIALDGSGNVYVAGGTTSNSGFPTTTGALQTGFGGGSLDAFVFELASSGGSLTFCTYLGGTGNDVASGIALDSSGIYVVGSTSSSDFKTTSGTIQATINGASNGFVAKLNTSGSALVYSTYLGGGTGDVASAVAVDSSNQAYVTGATQNQSFPTKNPFQSKCGQDTSGTCNGGLPDAFVSVINAAGSGFVYSTFLGGSGIDEGLGIAVDGSGDAYVTGLTQSSTNFPLQLPLQTKFGTGATQNAFVTELNPGGSALVYSTYLGGELADSATGIAVDSNKNAYVTGETSSTKFPTTTGAPQRTIGGGNDAFVSEISASGTSLLFSTYLGGALNENTNTSGGNLAAIGGIAVDSAGANVYVTGNTLSTNFPTTGGSVQTATGGGTDAFVAKYSTASTSTGTFTVTDGTFSSTSGSPGASATATITVTSMSGFNSAVTLACTVSPVVSKGPSCSFTSPGASVTPPANGTATATLNIATTAASAQLIRPSERRPSGIFYATLLPVFGITLFGVGIKSPASRRKKLFGLLMLGMVLMSLLLMPACGGSSNTGGSTGTPAGAYTFTVTGTSGATVVTGSPTLTFTVN